MIHMSVIEFSTSKPPTFSWLPEKRNMICAQQHFNSQWRLLSFQNVISGVSVECTHWWRMSAKDIQASSRLAWTSMQGVHKAYHEHQKSSQKLALNIYTKSAIDSVKTIVMHMKRKSSPYPLLKHTERACRRSRSRKCHSEVRCCTCSRPSISFVS